MNRARLLAAEMFAGAGVRIEWHGHTPSRGQLPVGAVVISLASHTPENLLPGAFALALPYEGVHITVFYRRAINRSLSRSAACHLPLRHCQFSKKSPAREVNGLKGEQKRDCGTVFPNGPVRSMIRSSPDPNERCTRQLQVQRRADQFKNVR